MPSAKTTSMPSQSTSYTTKTFAYASRSSASMPDGPRSTSKSRTYSHSRPMPTSSRSDSSSASSEDDFSGVPPNAFGIMHEWELESLEKWQRRLLQVRKDQTVLRARIDALKKQEESVWQSSTSKRSRSTSPASGQAQKEADLGEWARLLASEIMSLQQELAITMDSEDKAKKGIRKATTRLERLRSMEDRWKVPSPGATPPMSRSTSPGPVPPSHHHHHQTPRPKPQRQSSTSSTSSTNSTSTPPTSGPSSKGPTRKPSRTFSFDRERPSPPQPPLPKLKKHPLQPTTRAASLDPWLAYEDKWHQLSTNPSGAPIALRFASIPWPMLTQPATVEDIRVSDIREFVLNPRAIRVAGLKKEAKEGREERAEAKERRAMLRAAILRWHPDKFLGKFLGWVEEDERVAVKEGVGKVIRCLNEIMRVEDIRAKTL